MVTGEIKLTLLKCKNTIFSIEINKLFIFFSLFHSFSNEIIHFSLVNTQSDSLAYQTCCVFRGELVYGFKVPAPCAAMSS